MSKRILIVDDDKYFLETFVKILKLSDYEIESANSGIKALLMVQESAYDVIIMDVKMPGMDGLETYQKMRELSPNSTVILMTAYSASDLAHEVVQGGVYDILQKPLNAKMVTNMIDKVSQEVFISIVDNDVNLLRIMGKALRYVGYSVVTASSAEEAIEWVKIRKPKIMFIDVRLSFMDGIEAAKRIKAIDSNIEIVFMTAYRDEIDLNNVMEELGIKHCVYKPFKIDDVIKIVEELT